MSTRLLVLLCVVLLHPAVRLNACTCGRSTLCERLDQTPVIFLAEVVEGGVAPGEDPWFSHASTARLKIIEAFRGVPKNTHEIDINLLFMPGMCSPNPYLRGQQILVFTQFAESTRGLRDGGCTQSVRGKWIAEELSTVRRYFSGEMKTEINGRIAPNVDHESVDYFLSTKRTLPLAGATVIAEAHGKKYHVLSDANGNYSITGLPGGTFQVHAEMAGFNSRGREQTVRVKKGGCAVQDFGLWATNAVEGFVYDQRGAPVPKLNVFLRRAETKETFGKQAQTNMQGAFRFTQIDPGVYSAVISPAGETADSPYPKTTSTAPIQVGPASTIAGVTITLPPSIATRNIRIHVTDAGGKPLREGNMTCAQAAKEDAGYPMSEALSPKLGGSICRALADRTYHIRLERTTFFKSPKLANPPKAFVAPGLEDTDVHLKVP